MRIRSRSQSPAQPAAPRSTANRLSGSQSRRPTDPLYNPRASFSQSTPIHVPAPPPAHWPAWAHVLPRQMPRLAFPMFVVVAMAPPTVVMALPLALWTFGVPAMSGWALGLLAIGLTWGGLAILMRYQEIWESAPPPPAQSWVPPAAPQTPRAVFS